jgi:hypothetical protein
MSTVQTIFTKGIGIFVFCAIWLAADSLSTLAELTGNRRDGVHINTSNTATTQAQFLFIPSRSEQEGLLSVLVAGSFR